MTTKRLISAALLVIFSVVLFTSCTPDSIADDNTLYENQLGVDNAKVMRPING